MSEAYSFSDYDYGPVYILLCIDLHTCLFVWITYCVRQGKQLLGGLAENYGNMAPPTYLDPNPSPWPQQQMPPPNADTSPGSPARILTTSPSARRSLILFFI